MNFESIIDLYEYYTQNEKGKKYYGNFGIFYNEDNYVKLIKHLIRKDNLLISDININYLNKKYKIPKLELLFRNKINEFYKKLFGEDYYLYSWIYNQRTLFISENINNKDKIITIFNNYLKEYKIEINDIYNFNYYNILVKCHLICPIEKFFGTVLNFIIEYYEYKHAPYYFNRGYTNYWNYEGNRNFAMKYLIEKDLKLNINKIPLYITLTKIKNIGTGCLYNICKKFYNSLFEWINQCYPNMFTEKDFDIGFIKQEFDSVEEKQINDILHNHIKNVYYNNPYSDNVVKLNGMIPDWLLFSSELVLIEYIGYYTESPATSRQEAYMKTYYEKIEKYKELPYKNLFIYPSDLDNNFKGLISKINKIKGELI